MLRSARSGLGWGFLGVLAFSFTLPMTRLALGGLSPLFIGSARAVAAALAAAAVLALTRQKRPTRRQCSRLIVVAGGVVVGFPLLTTFALRTSPASHGAVVVGLLPALTALAAVVRGRERPPARFWLLSILGAMVAIGLVSVQDGSVGHLAWSDLMLLGAVVAAAIGYAEGGLLARQIGAWQTVSWALLTAAPLMLVLSVVSSAGHAPEASPGQWAAFGYLAAVSMYLGFFAWYRGLAVGPIAQVSQTQLLQPVLTITWSALLLGEHLTAPTLAGAAAVILCAALAVRARHSTPTPGQPPARPRLAEPQRELGRRTHTGGRGKRATPGPWDTGLAAVAPFLEQRLDQRDPNGPAEPNDVDKTPAEPTHRTSACPTRVEPAAPRSEENDVDAAHGAVPDRPAH